MRNVEKNSWNVERILIAVSLSGSDDLLFELTKQFFKHYHVV